MWSYPCLQSFEYLFLVLYLMKNSMVDCWCRKPSSDVCSRADIWCWWEEDETSFGVPSVKSNSRTCWFKVSIIQCAQNTLFYVILNKHKFHLILLYSRELTVEHRRLAEIIEMIHTASLIHDDVLDDSDIRRGKL
jgi:hypothetical protein